VMHIHTRTLLKAIALTAMAGCGIAWAQTVYPTKPIRLVVPFAPGGSTDIAARMVAEFGSREIGQQIVVENKAGAGGSTGMEFVAKSPADGYTLGMISSTHTISPWIYKSVPYDPIKSFTPIGKLVDSAYVLVVNPKVPANNVVELVKLAKDKPDVLHYASSGNGSTQHLMGGLFVSLSGAPLQHVPYRGSNLATTDLIAGVVESSFAGVPNVLPHLPSGKLRALAVTTAKRAPQLPNVPTMQEAGIAGYDASNWLALLAPAGTPAEIVQKLNREISKLMALPDVQKALFEAGVQISLSSPQELTKLMQEESTKWGKVVKDAGIRLQ